MFHVRMTFPTLSAAEVPAAHKPASAPTDELTLTLNTAFIRTSASSRCSARNLASELAQISKSPAAGAILTAVRQLAVSQGLTEMAAAEQLIDAFRKLDDIWSAYLYQEGLARVTSAE